jgi:hypothetical protein
VPKAPNSTMRRGAKLRDRNKLNFFLDTVMQSLFKLLEIYADDPDMIKLISAVIKEPTVYKPHRDLYVRIMNEKLLNEHTEAYYNEFNEFMYQETRISKTWHKFGMIEFIHRTHKDVNGRTLPARVYFDGDQIWMFENTIHNDDQIFDEELQMMITAPARIDEGGAKYWFKHGKIQRDDVDKFGNSLPNKILKNGTKYWRTNSGSNHRAELGKNKDDPATYDKPLPAVIHPCGTYEFYYDGFVISAEAIREKLLGPMPKDVFSNIKTMVIEYENGDVHRITLPVKKVSFEYA